jgi:hypothetical protein
MQGAISFDKAQPNELRVKLRKMMVAHYIEISLWFG